MQLDVGKKLCIKLFIFFQILIWKVLFEFPSENKNKMQEKNCH